MADYEDWMSPQEKYFIKQFHFDTGVEPPVWTTEALEERKKGPEGRK